MDSERIKGLDELIKKFKGDNIEILDKKISNLTAPGENYWSDMLRLDLTIKNKETGVKNIEHVVAKCVVTSTDDFMGDTSLNMFKSEILFYTEIIPTIQKFLKDHGLSEANIFPELMAARLNLDGQGDPDSNAVLILENLKEKGFINLDRHKGFDLDGIKMVLADLALFHAVPVAIRLLNPELFKTKIQNNCIFAPPKPPSGAGNGPPPFPFEVMEQIIKEDSFGKHHLNKFENIRQEEEEHMKKGMFSMNRAPQGPFASITHNDMWLNNTMQKLNRSKEITKNIFVDFQMYQIDDPTLDVIFLLLTSTDLITLENHFDYLLMYYHEHFIKILEALKCDVTPFRYSNFLKHIKEATVQKFFHIAVMNMTVIYAKKGERMDFEKNNQLKPSDIHPTAKGKFVFLFRQLVEKDWI